ncbi:MAG: hypothetical protein J2P21_20070, partial [Chloracidobacterium sp.]|nr:hypothetical protein [Chloracidobacterium sp.]
MFGDIIGDIKKSEFYTKFRLPLLPPFGAQPQQRDHADVAEQPEEWFCETLFVAIKHRLNRVAAPS